MQRRIGEDEKMPLLSRDIHQQGHRELFDRLIGST